MERFEKFTGLLNQSFNYVAGVGLVAMLGLTVADVISVKIFNSPIPGAIEFVSFLSVVVVTFSIAYTQQLKGHIQVEFFVRRLRPLPANVIGAGVSLLGVALFALLAWRSFEYGRILQLSGEVSMTERIPFYPFVYAIAFCCVPVCIQLIFEFTVFARRLVKR